MHFPPGFSRAAGKVPGDNNGRAPLGVLPRRRPAFDWGDGAPPRHTHDAVVYELHVKGFTARANSGVAPEKRGRFLGLIEKILYLQELGITVVELLPVHEFDPQEGNYWGYMTLNFFAPHEGYAMHDAVQEFREMIKAFHEARMEVWFTTTLARLTKRARPIRCVAWTTPAIIFCTLTAAIEMTLGAAIPPGARTLLCAP